MRIYLSVSLVFGVASGVLFEPVSRIVESENPPTRIPQGPGRLPRLAAIAFFESRHFGHISPLALPPSHHPADSCTIQNQATMDPGPLPGIGDMIANAPARQLQFHDQQPTGTASDASTSLPSSMHSSQRRQLEVSTSNLSQSSSASSAITPSTSQSNSQNQSIQGQDSTFPSRLGQVEPDPMARPVTPSHTAPQWTDYSQSRVSTPSSVMSGSPTKGSKRTASGVVKNAAHSAGPSPAGKTLTGVGHSRNTSLDSTSSVAGEVSLVLFALNLPV